MPIKSYVRDGAGKWIPCQCISGFDILQDIKDDDLESCPNCGLKVKRNYMHPFGVLFKGNGFYVTDNPKV